MVNAIPYQSCNISGGFWSNRQHINRQVTARAVYERFVETHRCE